MSLIRIREVKREIGHRSNASIYTDVKNGLLPPPVSIGQRAKAWPDYEVRAVVLARTAGRSRDEICELVRTLVARRGELFANASSQLEAHSASFFGVPALATTPVAMCTAQKVRDLASASLAKRGDFTKIKA